MHYRPFKDRTVSEVGMGCWGIGGNEHGNSYGTTNDATSIQTVRRALELGCTFFDTADVYGHGHSETILGLALQKARDRVILATKVGGSYMYGDEGGINFTEEYIRFALDRSLERLRTTWIDVYQLHNPTERMIKEGGIFAPLRRLQKEGKIRAVGCSVHTLEEGIAALDWVDSIQCVFNVLNPKNFELMETARRRNIAVIIREPLLNGFASGKYTALSNFEDGDIRSRMPTQYKEELSSFMQDIRSRLGRNEPLVQLCLKYVLMFPSVSVVIPGAKTPAQVEENMKASDIPPLTSEQMSVFGS